MACSPIVFAAATSAAEVGVDADEDALAEGGVGALVVGVAHMPSPIDTPGRIVWSRPESAFQMKISP